jgi:hypothetical protein
MSSGGAAVRGAAGAPTSDAVLQELDESASYAGEPTTPARIAAARRTYANRSCAAA